MTPIIQNKNLHYFTNREQLNTNFTKTLKNFSVLSKKNSVKNN